MTRGGQPVSVLIVEDSPTQAQKLKGSLEEKGFAVTTAGSGHEGVAAVRTGGPDLVISDIVMPGLDGYDMCRAIKADPGLRDIPVILLTSLSDPQDVVRGLECGADGFTVKTGSAAPVLKAIERLLRSRALDAETPDPAAIQVELAGKVRTVSAKPQRIFDFLISTYDAAFQGNAELQEARDELARGNAELEERVKARTEELARKNQEVSATYQQLWHSAKLATLGELTASVAHELNNPLQTVSLRVESLARRFSRDGEILESLSVVEKEVDRMAHLVQNLLHMGRRGTQVAETLSAAAELEKTLDLLEHHLRRCGVRANKDFSPGTPSIRFDPEQLQQAFLNLITNACDAMPNGGTLTLRVHGETEVRIEISDTGAGISAEDLPRVMETFFTTKPPGKGTGLGLPICRRVVEAHGGVLSIESQMGRGTTVCMTLPAEPGEMRRP
jgi:signal transduction histidine kinase